jgi:hypothetical protein
MLRYFINKCGKYETNRKFYYFIQQSFATTIFSHPAPMPKTTQKEAVGNELEQPSTKVILPKSKPKGEAYQRLGRVQSDRTQEIVRMKKILPRRM